MLTNGPFERKLRRTGLTAGVVALLFQVLAWAWMPMPAMAAGSLTICTSYGLKVVAVDADGTPLSSHDSGTGETDHGCPLCSLVSGLSVPPRIERALPVDSVRHGPQGLPGERIAAGWFLSTLQARAPPSFG